MKAEKKHVYEEYLAPHKKKSAEVPETNIVPPTPEQILEARVTVLENTVKELQSEITELQSKPQQVQIAPGPSVRE